MRIEAFRQTFAKLESEVRIPGDIIKHLSKSEPRTCLVDLIKMTRKVVATLAEVARLVGTTVRIDARPLALRAIAMRPS